MYIRHIGTDGMKEQFFTDCPKIAGADTETTGLHIKFDKAFLVVFGWEGHVYTFPPTEVNMSRMYECAQTLDKLFFWNTKFDMHMLRNAGFPYPFQNLSDGMFLARLALNADDKQSLALKAISNRFVKASSSMLQDEVKGALTALKKTRNKIFYNYMKEATGLTKKKIDFYLKDLFIDKPDGFEDLVENFNETYPEPNYSDIDIELLQHYASNDVEIMLDFIKRATPVVIYRQQENILKIEEQLIYPLYEMESVGFKMDREYLKESKEKVKEYILRLRQELEHVYGAPLTVGQHAVIKQHLLDSGANVTGADEANLVRVMSTATGDLKRFCELVVELRTLEKWYSTYILRLLEGSKVDGRSYTSINQAGTVSGRVSSDFQQFPKNNLHDSDGNVLFEPRRAFVVSGDGYDSIYYLDYSQIELRVQADYTFKISGGDTNLCRAYMPFQCRRKNGELFDPTIPEHLKEWNTGDWYTPEGELWEPTDVHGATTSQAFPDLEVGSKQFKDLRKIGKTVNFARHTV